MKIAIVTTLLLSAVTAQASDIPFNDKTMCVYDGKIQTLGTQITMNGKEFKCTTVFVGDNGSKFISPANIAHWEEVHK